MPTCEHKTYSISVVTDHARFNTAYFIPKVRVLAEYAKPGANINTDREFAAESEAVQYGFELGKKWIDTRLY